MTTAANPTAVGPKAASGHAGHTSRAQGAGARATDTAADGGGGGFLAILGAVDGALGDTPPADMTGSGAAALAATTGDASALLPPVPFDASTLLLQNPQIAAAQALQASDTGVAKAATATPAATSAPAVGAAPVGDAPLALAATADGVLTERALARSAAAGPLEDALAQPADAASASAAPLASASAATLRAAQAADAAGKPSRGGALAAAANSALLAQADTGTQALQQAFARMRAGQDGLQSGANTSTPATGNAPATASDATPFLTVLEQSKAAAGPAATEPVLAPLLVKLEKSQAERERGGTDLKRAEPTYAGSTVGLSLADGSPSGAAAPVLAPEMQVAEQVSYWVSHNVQNAELSLDGLGQSPVQVSISLQGNEAQITFRTDEAAAREVLQNAGAHLKEMLQSEGLVLTGVSVGHAGSGNADGSERRPRHNLRQTLVAALPASGTEARTGRVALVGSAGRSVDLFV